MQRMFAGKMFAGRKFAQVAIALMLLTCLPQAFAMSEVIFVTKETQSKQGLNFTLSAVRVSKTAILVEMEIPQAGKLKDLKRVALDVGTYPPGVATSPEVLANLQTTAGKNGSLLASFQLSPELADKASIRLVTIDHASALSGELYYSVQLKGYVTNSVLGNRV